MAKNKNTVSGNKEETDLKDREKTQNSMKNRETNSARSTSQKETKEYDKY